jgi:hypothetical protein
VKTTRDDGGCEVGERGARGDARERDALGRTDDRTTRSRERPIESRAFAVGDRGDG